MIDMVVAILLLSILSAVTAPRMTEVLARHRLESAGYMAAASVNYLKDRALIEGRDITATFTSKPPGLVCDQVPMPNQPGQTFTLDLSTEATISNVSYSGITGTTLRFDRFGDLYDAAGRVTHFSISLANSKATTTITLDQETISVATSRN